MPLPGYRRLNPNTYETPSGQQISKRQYQKIQRGGISNEQYAKIRRDQGTQTNYQHFLDEYLSHAGTHHKTRREAMQDEGFKRAYKHLSQPYHKKDTMSEAKWKRYGFNRWDRQVKALKYIYGQQDLTGDVVSKYFSPEQE